MKKDNKRKLKYRKTKRPEDFDRYDSYEEEQEEL